jgi:hypothetical protein
MAAAPSYTGCAHSPAVKQEQVVQQEQTKKEQAAKKQEEIKQEEEKKEPEKQGHVKREEEVKKEERPVTIPLTPLGKKLQTISDFFEKNEINYMLFWDAQRNYLVAREHLDDDNIKDYILVVGFRTKTDPNEPEYPHGIESAYVEDTSKRTGLGNVDRMCGYQESDGISQIVCFDIKERQRQFYEYVSLRSDDPDYDQKMQKLRRSVRLNQTKLRDANIAYRDIISGLEYLIKAKGW